MASSDFGRVSYTEAIDICRSPNKFDYPVSWGCDLQTEHERFLTEQHFKRPVFVTDYPKEIKAFYMRLNDDGKTVAAADCLVPGIGEIIGGSQREERLDVLEAPDPGAGHEHRDLQVLSATCAATAAAATPASAWAFERMVMYLTGVSNIRDVLPHQTGKKRGFKSLQGYTFRYRFAGFQRKGVVFDSRVCRVLRERRRGGRHLFCQMTQAPRALWGLLAIFQGRRAEPLENPIDMVRYSLVPYYLSC